MTGFKSYLTNRRKFVSYKTEKSGKEDIQCGVPQGSILGPLLFIVYMNDICYTFGLLKTILFADDTTCFIHTKMFKHHVSKLTMNTMN